MILKSELSSKHTFEAINWYAISALSYGFPALDWTITQLEITDTEIRKMLQQYHAMHSQSDVARLYLLRKNRRRGLINITNHYKNAIINFSSYLLNSKEQFLKQTGSNWRRKIYPPKGTATLWWTWPWSSTTGCYEEIAAENHHQICKYQQTGGGTQKKEYSWAICKIPGPTLCWQRVIQPMA